MTNFLTVTVVNNDKAWILKPGQSYKVIGIDFDVETTYFYVVTSTNPLNIQRLDEQFFQEQDFVMPEGWSFKVNPNNSSEREIMLTDLVKFDNWFALYQQSDPTVMEILRKIFE